MGRRKKTEEESDEMLEAMAAEEMEEAMEETDDEVEANETDDEVEANETVDEDEESDTSDDAEESEEEEKPASKAKRKRAPRKKKESKPTVASLLKQSSESEDAVEVEAEIEAAEEPEPDPEVEEKPKRQRRARAAKAKDEDEAKGDDVAVISAASVPLPPETNAAMLEKVREISTGLSTNLEKVSQMMTDLPVKYAGTLEEIFRAPKPKPTFLTKLAVGMSAIAVVLSLLSISLSHTVRRQMLGREAETVAAVSIRNSVNARAPRASGEAAAVAVAGPRVSNTSTTPAAKRAARTRLNKR